jgi:hypothetical protein
MAGGFETRPYIPIAILPLADQIPNLDPVEKRDPATLPYCFSLESGNISNQPCLRYNHEIGSLPHYHLPISP